MRELLERYLNESVRIVKSDGFVLIGTIEKVTSDGILFFTKGQERLISFQLIVEVIPLGGTER